VDIEDKTLQHKKRAFLEAYSQTGNITRAAEISEVSRQSHYEWLKDDSDYPAAFKEADEKASERLEAEARRRAVEGTSKPVFYQGMVCGAIQEYSDTLLMFLLKGAKPQKYRDNVSMEHTGKDGSPIEIRNMSDAEIDAALAKEVDTAVQKELERLGHKRDT
jgi:hypothetical protein